MIIYEGTKRTFNRDVNNGVIADRVVQLFRKYGVFGGSDSEVRAFNNSLPRMAVAISDSRIPDASQVAIEYQIPLTSKRVDFMIGGKGDNGDNVVVVELKQWEDCEVTDRENIVNAFTGGAKRDVVHPSQQVYSYAKLIENYNEGVRDNRVSLIPCAFLHNFKEEYRSKICSPHYREALEDAPVFLREDGEKLTDYIAKFIKKPSDKNLFKIIDNGKIKPSKSLQETVGKILNGSEEFVMIDEQQVAFATIMKLVEDSFIDDKKHTLIIQGGPGTGKSVIAINLLAKIIEKGFSCFYVTKTSAPRATFSHNLIKGKHNLGYLKGLFMSSGSFYDLKAKTSPFDCLLVDEAHRLNAKSGLYHNQGENQIKEIIAASKVSVFFIDEDQVISTSDIGSIEQIKHWANELGSEIHCGDDLILKSQFRCNGSDGYLAFLDDVLQIRKPDNDYGWYDIDYDLRFFDDPAEMREALREKNGNNKARMIAGYCYHWDSKNDKTKYDIILGPNFKAQWNFSTDSFAIDPDSFEQVGCIHSTQGLEFEYAGIIIGTDLRYDGENVIADFTRRDKNDKTMSGIKTGKNYALADKIIRNTYKTLLSRGLKGCFVYCEDKALGDYLKNRYAVSVRLAEDFKKENTFVAEDDPPRPMVFVRYFETMAAAGYSEDTGNVEFLDGIENKIEMYEDEVPHGTDFAVTISGESMEPTISDGDTVCVSWKQRKFLQNGDIGIFNVDGKTVCKRYFIGRNGLYLVSDNEDLKDSNIFISYNSDERFICRGKVLGHRREMPEYFEEE